MRAIIQRHYRDLVNGLLFRPVLLTLAHGLLAVGVVTFDHHIDLALLPGSISTARAVLTTIAGSSFTAVSIAFTVTIVTLQLVSGQFTPRALRGFLGQPGVQRVAGDFMGLVLYCLIALGLMPDVGGSGDYSLPMTVGIALAIVALFVLLIFIDRIARAIQVSNIVADLAANTRQAFDRHYAVDGPGAGEPRSETDADWPTLCAGESGVVQSVDIAGLTRVAERTGVALRLAVQPGDFVIAGEPVARLERGRIADLEPAGGADVVRRAVVCRAQRDMQMDPAFGVRQLADIAVRALSPGINDPSTADHCLHWLSALFCPLLAEPRPTVRRWAAGDGVVEMPLRPMHDLLQVALEEIALYGTDNPRMRRGIQRTLDRLDRACHPSHRAALEALRARLHDGECDGSKAAVLEQAD